jgi:hypothetical protein
MLYIKRREVGKQPSAPSASSPSGNDPMSDNGLGADDQPGDKAGADDTTVHPTVRHNPWKNKGADDWTMAGR